MGAAHAKLAADMQGASIPGALDVDDQRTPQCFSVLSSRLSHSRTSNGSKASTSPCSQPNEFLRAKEHMASQDEERRRTWRTDAALLLDLFESAKLAGAVKDTSNEGPTEWMLVASDGLSPLSSRTPSLKSCGDNGAEKFEREGNSFVSDAATEDADTDSDVLGLASLGLLMDVSTCLVKDACPGASEVESTVVEGTWA